MNENRELQQKFFLGRQPILDVNKEIVAYELLFRTTESNWSEFDSQDYASSSVIMNTITNFGWREVIGDKIGFINITEEVLMTEMIEVLPKECTVLELLENIDFNEHTIKRVAELKTKGFRIALDDHVFAPEHAELYNIVNIVKVNLLDISPQLLPQMVADLKKYPVILLAECVETMEQFKDCLAMGFKLFQGYFFERPEVLKRKALEASKISMLKLLDSLNGEMEITRIEEIFRGNPDLSYNMLKLVNSVQHNLRTKIKGLRHAIMILGVLKLRRWAQLAIFSSSDARGINNPLLEMAAVRGRLMEYLIMQRHSLSRNDDMVEAAFMTGIVSLLDVLFETTMEVIVSEFSLSDAVSAALLNREGELGGLLALAETLEMVNFGEVQRLVEFSELPVADLLEAQLIAYNWRSSIGAAEA